MDPFETKQRGANAEPVHWPGTYASHSHEQQVGGDRLYFSAKARKHKILQSGSEADQGQTTDCYERYVQQGYSVFGPVG